YGKVVGLIKGRVVCPNFRYVRSLGHSIDLMAQIIGYKHISRCIKSYPVTDTSLGECQEYYSFPFPVYDPDGAPFFKINGEYVSIGVYGRTFDAFCKSKFRCKIYAMVRTTGTTGRRKKRSKSK